LKKLPFSNLKKLRIWFICSTVNLQIQIF